ncbi:hypothetical protein FQZ97_808560 [compost metagenome]
MMVEARPQFKNPILGTRIRVTHYAMHRIRSRLVFTQLNRRKVCIDGVVQHDLPTAQTVRKHAIDNELRCICRTCQVFAGLLQKAASGARTRCILRRIWSPLACQT